MSALKGTPTHPQRGGALTNGSLPRRAQTPSKLGSSTPTRSTSGNRCIRTTPHRPTRINTAVNASPRKVSAPGKLISSVGCTLDYLPDTVTVRRKASTPVKSNNTNNKTQVKYSTKKSSAPAKIVPESTENRISKDHGSSSSSQSPQQGSSSSASGSSSGGTTGKSDSASSKGSSGKKGFTSYAAAAVVPETSSLATVKEEKSLFKFPRKMSEPVQSSSHHHPPPKKEILRQKLSASHDDLVATAVTSPPPLLILGTTTAKDDNDRDRDEESFDAVEKLKLEKVISDLIKNNECKKQEIAALKMEINRLKETAREKKPPTIHVESSTAAKIQDDGEEETVAINAWRKEEEETTRLQDLVDTRSTENRLLRDHLKQLEVSLDSSPLSDQQKELILSTVSGFSQNGALETISNAGDKEWDNKSSSSISEISVACLQGRIHQMEETHYSTHEELQATLQELEDLKEQFSDCQLENQQLLEEKQVILESLTQQTEKLNESRNYNDTLKIMLIQQCENSQDVSQCEKTQRLMELLKNVQEDQELVLLKQEEYDQQLHASKDAEEHYHRESQRIRERMKLLETMVEMATKDKRDVENQLMTAHERIKEAERDGNRLKISLSTAKDKITELEAAVISGEKSELADVLESVRSEKEMLEKEVTLLHKKLGNLNSENERLKDQNAGLEDNLRVTRNNAKTHLDDVEWKRSQLNERRVALEQQMDYLKVTVEETQMACQRHLEDKRDLKTSLSEAQKKFTEMVERQAEIERAFSDERDLFTKQVEEWEQFQKDLLTSVRVANDFKTEAQHNLEKHQQENILLKERLRLLEIDLERMRVTTKYSNAANGFNTNLTGSAADRRLYRMTNGEPILNERRNSTRPLSRGDSRVKSLIESIECATKQTKAGSRSSSTSSLASNASETNNNNVKSQLLKRADTDVIIRNLPSLISPLKDSLNTTCSSPLRVINCNSLSDSLSLSNKSGSNLPDTVKMSQLTNEKNSVKLDSNKPLSILINKIEPIRKNSYGNMPMIDKKDPLASLAQNGGSKRNALLKWCQNKTLGYTNVDITNFSSSWNDGLAFCAILDTYLPDKIRYKTIHPSDKKRNFELAFEAAESVGISTNLDLNDMITLERPSWQLVFNYVTSIFSHFET